MHQWNSNCKPSYSGLTRCSTVLLSPEPTFHPTLPKLPSFSKFNIKKVHRNILKLIQASWASLSVQNFDLNFFMKLHYFSIISKFWLNLFLALSSDKHNFLRKFVFVYIWALKVPKYGILYHVFENFALYFYLKQYKKIVIDTWVTIAISMSSKNFSEILSTIHIAVFLKA